MAEMTYERQRHADETEAKDLVERLSHFVNTMSREHVGDLATALANEHPTLLGQMAKAMAIGVMRRATYDPDWKPWDGYERTCFGDGSQPKPKHAAHDGRLSCDTVIGAELMAHQAFI